MDSYVRKAAASVFAIWAICGASGFASAQITVTGDVTPPGLGPGNEDIGTQNLRVGNTAAGTMSVIGGATFSGRAFFVGDTSTGNGSFTLSGAGSRATATTGFGVGRSGIGVLNIQSGASVFSLGNENFSAIVGEFAGSNGTVNVDGGTLSVNRADNSPFLAVGMRSTGALNVTNGGRVTLGDASSGTGGIANGVSFQIGSFNSTTDPVPPANGSVLVSGVGSKIEVLGQNGSLNVGRMGSGTIGSLTIQNGGTVDAGRFVGIGRGRETGGVTEPGLGATGTVIVDGATSRLNVTGFATCCGGTTGNGAAIHIGRNDGTGTLTVRNGAVVNLNSAGATNDAGGVAVAHDSLSSGALNIQSGGRLALVTDNSSADTFGMTVGRLGSGQLNIIDGGQLTITSTGGAGGGLSFGGNGQSGNGGAFTALISGAGSAVTLSGIDMSMTVGSRNGSTGTVTIEAGAVVAPGNRSVIAGGAGSSGTLNVSGPGTTLNFKSSPGDEFGAGLSVGRSGVGIANISAGAVVNVDGTASPGTLRHTTNVGGTGTQSGGTGTLTITGAGTQYNVSGTVASLSIGRDITNGVTPTQGTMTISDGAKVNFPTTGTGSVGFTAGSTGTLTVTGAGSSLNMGAFLGVGRTFNDAAGGTGTLNVLDGGVVKAASVHVGTTGTLTGDGTIDGSVTNDGSITPGSSPGTLSITGNLTLTDASVVTIEIAGKAPGQFDVIAVGGTVLLDGTLRIVQGGSYVPAVGDVLDVLTFGNGSGNFDSVIVEGFSGATFSTSLGAGAFQVTAVPEPDEWALLATGLVVVGVAALRRRRALLVA